MSERKRLSKGRLSVYVMALLLGTALVACARGISQEDYDAALAGQEAAKTQVADLESQLSSAIEDNAKLQGQIETITEQRDARLKELTTTREEVGSLGSQLTASQAENSDLSNQLSTAMAENDLLEAQLNLRQVESDSLENDLSARSAQLLSVQAQAEQLNAQAEQLNAQVEQLNAVYPPRRFRDEDELRAWWMENVSEIEAAEFAVEGFGQARETQLMAALDGYIISADFWEYLDTGTVLVWNSAVTDEGTYYVWFPGQDKIGYSYDTDSLTLEDVF